MNILMILAVPLPPSDGIGSHALGLAGRLRSRGHTVTFITRGKSKKLEELVWDGFRIVRVPFPRFHPLRVQVHGRRVERTIHSLSPPADLIHCHSPLVSPFSRKFPLVTTFHSAGYTDFSFTAEKSVPDTLRKLMARTINYRLEKRLLSLTLEVILVHERVLGHFKKYYDDTRNYHVIPNVVDTNFFKPSPAPVPAKNLLYVGRLDYRKGLHDIVLSARTVVDRFPEVKYVLIGQGPFRKRLEKEVRKTGLTEHFVWKGEIKDPRVILSHYQEASAVLLPSYTEGSPMVMWEAMACGKPLIAAASGFEKGILEDGRDSLLVRPGSFPALATAALRVLSSPEIAGNLGREARKKAVARMDLEANTDKVEEVYRLAAEKYSMIGSPR